MFNLSTSLYYEHKVGPKEVRIRQFSHNLQLVEVGQYLGEEVEI